LGDHQASRERSSLHHTLEDIAYRSLSDADMLACQLALPQGERRLDRVAYFENLLKP
jgi:hypothetical protein